MTQGSIKKPKAFGGINRVSKVSKPKKSKTAADRMKKKLSAGLATRTEEMLSGKAGNMKLVGKGTKGENLDQKLKKGGSKKFG